MIYSMTRLLLQLSLLLALLPGMAWAAAVEPQDLLEPTVHVSSQDGTLSLSISYRVPVSPREAWAVLTDFEHMADFIPNLDSSRVLQRTDKRIEVEQNGSAGIGLLSFHYESRRQVEITPFQSIRSHTLSGNARVESTMVLTPAGSGTLLSYHATAVPDLPLPGSLINSYFNDMLEKQFKAMGREMLRRSQAGGEGPPQLAQPPVLQAAEPPAAQAIDKVAAAKAGVISSKPAPKRAMPQTRKRPG
jgi:carbon monoxide dehydrogenase subunit G